MQQDIKTSLKDFLDDLMIGVNKILYEFVVSEKNFSHGAYFSRLKTMSSETMYLRY
jgi:hypothetical protein